MVGENALELLGRFFKIAGIELRDGIVVALLGGEKRQARAYRAGAAGADVHLAAFHDLGWRGGQHFSKAAMAFSYLPCCTS